MNIVNNNNNKDKTWSPRAEILSYVNLVSQLLDLIETWGFREDIKHVKDIKKFKDSKDVKDIKNIVDVNNNNNKDNGRDIKIENFIKMLTQYLSSWTW